MRPPRTTDATSSRPSDRAPGETDGPRWRIATKADAQSTSTTGTAVRLRTRSRSGVVTGMTRCRGARGHDSPGANVRRIPASAGSAVLLVPDPDLLGLRGAAAASRPGPHRLGRPV